nr:hypothetical protein CFP56_03986 [Quercus suber]
MSRPRQGPMSTMPIRRSSPHSCGHDDSGTKVAGEKVDVKGHGDPGPRRNDGEEGDSGRDDKDDEDGRDAHPDRAIVFRLAKLDVADDLAVEVIVWGDTGQVNAGGVEGVHSAGSTVAASPMGRRASRRRARQENAGRAQSWAG